MIVLYLNSICVLPHSSATHILQDSTLIREISTESKIKRVLIGNHVTSRSSSDLVGGCCLSNGHVLLTFVLYLKMQPEISG